MQEAWDSECSDRKRRMECTESCKCDATKCQNRAISKKQAMKLSVDVKEQRVYGIDKYTQLNILSILPDEMLESTGDENAKQKYLEEVLLPAMNGYESFVRKYPRYASKRPLNTPPGGLRAPFYMTDVLRSLLYKVEQQGDTMLQKVTSYAIRVILTMASYFGKENKEVSLVQAKQIVQLSDCTSVEQHLAAYEKNDITITKEGAICDEEFPIYSKGTGVVCIRPQGIPQYQFVVSFFGKLLKHKIFIYF
ncbi:hypothetical protein RFI_07696 [Reticulomyxa filosa]|uniref:AWS domain-containing protein n=1 Tax=Reticulomyxa filosa TaxID=46433 RepID=X6NVY9_RETFI|nr:hypothetical protein RFI_07696 [Reticulomyxa filosa]|eukprot:ETO29427.1 hypothetical protein RFI_07696 [Reticulomyxa filosa]